MRRTFYEEFKKQDAYLLYDDVGYGVIEVDNPNCINVGIAEQAMIGMAAGMASCGAKVYCYFITPHIFRAWDFVRNLIAYKDASVTLVGVGVDDEYAHLGKSHTATAEEMNLSCTAIGLNYYRPYFADQLRDLMKCDGPMFIHLSRGEAHGLSVVQGTPAYDNTDRGWLHQAVMERGSK